MQRFWNMQRQSTAEKMEDPEVAGEMLRRALNGIDRLHWLLGTFRSMVDRVARGLPDDSEPVTVLDVGAGSGYLGRILFERFGDRVRYLRQEPSGRILEAAPPTRRERVMRARGEAIPVGTSSVDVTVSSLLLHHLSPDDRNRFLREALRVSRHLVLHHDLVRHRLHYWLTHVVTLLLTPNPVNRYDGPVSVARSHTVQEWKRLMENGELGPYRVETQWPWRVNLVAELSSS